MARQQGFTLVEILVVLAIMAVLAAMMLPVLGRARQKARTAVCQANLRQISEAALMYAQDYDGRLPCYADANCGPEWRRFWHQLLEPYVSNMAVFICPEAGPGKPPPNGLIAKRDNLVVSYGCAYPHVFGCGWHGGNPLAVFDTPAQDILAVDHHYRGDSNEAEETGGCCPRVLCPLCTSDRRGAVSNRHNGGANAAFLDGHAKWLPKSEYYLKDLWGHQDNLSAPWGYP
ncbi:MAG: prepilin-type N-terminal cleavage/methylation domain-containing protein [Armatimonadetes bacterium]|nr:prepilin-type N-terminal cleavage/methylation domain-containing protein [Armatimonadota bacterium]